MIQKPDTMLELFEGHPERWTQGAYARNAAGESCQARSEDACCFCLLGAMNFVYDVDAKAWPAMALRISEVVGGSMTYFNDHSTFEQIVKAVREAQV